MSKPQPKVVTLLHTAPFLLELHSERMVDAMHALADAGFKVTHVIDTKNRFRVDDAQEQSK